MEPLKVVHSISATLFNHTNIINISSIRFESPKYNTYVILFTMIKQLPNWNQIRFKVDYENAAMHYLLWMAALTTTTKRSLRKDVNYKITNGQEDPKNKLMVSLSSVQEETMNGWTYIISRYDGDGQQIQKNMKYLKTQWLREEFLEIWCVFGETLRTYNLIKGWHNKLIKTDAKKNPNKTHYTYTVRNIQRQKNEEPPKNDQRSQ